MKMLSWNSRDSAWPSFIFQALFYISASGLNVLCILDCKASRVRAKVIAQSLSFNGFFCIPTIGQYGGIILLWNPSVINITI